MIGGNDVPGSRFRAAFVENVLICILIVVPKLTLLDVQRRKLPFLPRRSEAFFEPLFLLVFADVKEKFQNDGIQFTLELLESIDLVVTFFPDFLGHQVVNPPCKHVLILGPVEYANVPMARHGTFDPPQKVMIQFLPYRNLERHNLAALRVETSHYMFDRAVLATRIHSLKHDQECPLMFRIEAILKILQF